MQNLDFNNLSLMTFISIYITGIASSFGPCIYPVIPVTAGFIGSRSGNTADRIRAALFYVLGLALCYTFIAMATVYTGRIFGSLTTNQYVYLAFGILILALGGNIIGCYDINVTELDEVKLFGSELHFWGPFIVGACTGLVASPCATPGLSSLLSFMAGNKATVAGWLLMLAYSMGMATILFFIGALAAFLEGLPKTYIWILRLKRLLGFALVSSGVYYIFMAGHLS
ncbi:MAG: sulfite exporter TauE/SafE family protein [Elusimicrobia bacterium]|nr:sulfite exporter TauE/SafE family protein [Candidatus Liberimonas magnetica]